MGVGDVEMFDMVLGRLATREWVRMTTENNRKRGLLTGGTAFSMPIGPLHNGTS